MQIKHFIAIPISLPLSLLREFAHLSRAIRERRRTIQTRFKLDRATIRESCCCSRVLERKETLSFLPVSPPRAPPRFNYETKVRAALGRFKRSSCSLAAFPCHVTANDKPARSAVPLLFRDARPIFDATFHRERRELGVFYAGITFLINRFYRPVVPRGCDVLFSLRNE